MEITKLRPILQTELKRTTNNVFYERTKGTPSFPYVVYDLNSYSFTDVIDQAELEINIFDNLDDTTRIETLADAYWNQFDHAYFINNDLCYATYQNVRNNIDTGDSQVHQRRIVIVLRIC